MSGAITSAIGDYGLYAVFVLMLVDAVFPAASELVMVYGGAVAAGALTGHHVTLFGLTIESHAWAYVAMALAGTVGYTIGCGVGWAIGFYGGRAFLERRGRWFHLTPAKLERAERWFDRYDDWAVFLGRMLPVVRSFIAIPAGVFETPFVRYTVLSFLGTLPWCFGLAGVGLAVGKSWERFHHGWRYADYVVAAAVVLAALVVIWRLRRRRLAQRSAVERA